MVHTPIRRDQFEFDKHHLVHKPTGARFSTYPSRTDISNVNWKMAGRVLPNGDEYDQEDLRRMAQQLLFERGPVA
jgi:hypothetical protein